MNANPHRCACFGGYCWRQFCHEKTVAKHRKAEERRSKPIEELPGYREARERSERRTPRVLVWRWDGSHENGPIPPGRIPPKRTK
jgi:hypothetical protein